MVDELITEPPVVEVVGNFIYLTVTSGDETRTFVLRRSDATRLSIDLEDAVNQFKQG